MFSFSCGYRFDAKVFDKILSCVQRMVPILHECLEISKEMEIYRMVAGTSGFSIVVQDGKTRILGKIHFASITPLKMYGSFCIFMGLSSLTEHNKRPLESSISYSLIEAFSRSH